MRDWYPAVRAGHQPAVPSRLVSSRPRPASSLLAAPGVRTALVAEVAELEPVVGEWRAAYDPSAALGMPAHVTVLWPWLPTGALRDTALLDDLRDVLATVPGFDVTFGTFERFERTLWLAPVPSDPFVRLTTAVEQRWPECPPYEGRFDSVVPHLTVGDAVDVDALAHVVAAVAPQLPVTARVETVSLMALGESGRWTRQAGYPLAAG